jgi:hypothetical protein
MPFAYAGSFRAKPLTLQGSDYAHAVQPKKRLIERKDFGDDGLCDTSADTPDLFLSRAFRDVG